MKGHQYNTVNKFSSKFNVYLNIRYTTLQHANIKVAATLQDTTFKTKRFLKFSFKCIYSRDSLKSLLKENITEHEILTLARYYIGDKHEVTVTNQTLQ